jgi:HEAT repeat protein/TolA-binding protein
MKRVCLFVALLMCFPLAAEAQVPRVPPVPPAPAVPPVAPEPPILPRVVVSPAGVDTMAMIDSMNILNSVDIQDAVIASRQMVEDLDIGLNIEGIKDMALRQIDVEGIKAQAKAQADSMREQADALKQQMKDQSEAIKERAKEVAKAAADKAIQMKDFAYQMRGPGNFNINIQNSSDGAYNSGLNDVNRRQYDQAIVRFDQSIAQKSAHADGALYWKAYAQYKLGKSDDALATLAELRRSYAQSRYLSDSRVLEADVRKSSGKPVTGDVDNDEIKLLAISSMQNSNPEGAVPLLENVLKATNSLQVKKRALFVLASNDQPAAHQVLVNYAKGSGNPDLQVEAIRYLTARKGKTTNAELEEIYNSTQDLDVRRAVLDALVSAGDKPALLRYAGGNSAVEVRQRAIQGLGSANLITATELMALYQKEDNKDLRQTMVRAFSSMGAVDQITQIIKTEKDPSVRQQAIRSLGGMKTERTGPALVELYGAEQDKDVRKAVISALGSQNNVDGLVSIARKETNPELKLEVVRRIADMAPRNKAAMDYLMEQIK